MGNSITTRQQSEGLAADLRLKYLKGAPIVDASDNLQKDMKLFFKVKGLSNQERYLLFDSKLEGRIPRELFYSIVRSMNIRGLKEDKLALLFQNLDTNKTGYVSENEFRLAFDDVEAPVGQVDYRIDKNEEEIREAFRIIDENSDNSLTLDEMIHALSKMGLNMSS